MSQRNLKAQECTCYNKATKIIVSTLGVILGISGMGHGFFEILQGNTQTNGLVIHAIGEADRLWIYGTEPAFTLIPNFLITGILSIIVSLVVIIWSIGFVHKKNGPLIFLLLFILLFLVGGGIGQIIFFTLGWAISTRINKPLIWWQKNLSVSARKIFSELWLLCLITSSLLLLFALEIAIFGLVPSVKDPDRISMVMLFSLGSCLVLYILAFISGFAHDIEKQEIIEEG